MSFRISGLPAAHFQYLFGLADDELLTHRARRVVADCSPGYPDRIELRDARVGESLILVNFTHQPANSPYHASHAVFVIEGASHAYRGVDVIPEVLQRRVLSLRAFDSDGMIVGADLVDGLQAEVAVRSLLDAPRTEYIHAHYAKHGCFAARIERAD